HGQLTQIDFANGVSETHDFDPATFYLRGSRVSGPGGSLYDAAYTYDAVGNPLAITDHLPQGAHTAYSRQFTYDALYRITGMHAQAGAQTFDRAYQYDAAGNFSQNGEFGPGTLFLEAGGSNRISGVTLNGADTVLFGYDAGGNMTASPGRTL